MVYERDDQGELELRVAGVDWRPVSGLPEGGREECRSGERPCVHVRCRYHLWRIDACDREGNPDLEAGTTLRPRWLEVPTPACCALDVIEAQSPAPYTRYRSRVGARLQLGGDPVRLEQHRTAEEVAELVGVSPRRVEQIVRIAIAKLRLLPEARELLHEIIFGTDARGHVQRIARGQR